MQYFENLQSNLNKHQESSPICKSENEEHVMEQVSEVILLKMYTK